MQEVDKSEAASLIKAVADEGECRRHWYEHVYVGPRVAIHKRIGYPLDEPGLIGSNAPKYAFQFDSDIGADHHTVSMAFKRVKDLEKLFDCEAASAAHAALDGNAQMYGPHLVTLARAFEADCD